MMYAINLNEDTRYVIATNAVGINYFENWTNFSKPNWIDYVKKYDIGIAVFDENIIADSASIHKTPAWQKLLLPKILWTEYPMLEKVALIDTDVVFSPWARNIFDYSGNSGLGVVSQNRNLPFNLSQIKRRIAFLRHSKFSSDYPLDSELFADPRNFFLNRNLPPHEDYFCSGVVVVNDEKTAEIFHSWYARISRVESEEIRALYGTWEEPYVNSWAQSELNLTWMPYSFQALWNYELAWNYASFYEFFSGSSDSNLKIKVLEATLFNCDLLHFAGGWHESTAWQLVPQTFKNIESFDIASFNKYLEIPVTGKPLGKILPNRI